MTISDTQLKRWANYATIIASITAIITLIAGFFIFRQTSKDQAEAASVKIMQDYLQFNFTHKELLGRGERGQIDEEYLWFAAHNLLTAETIYNLNRGDKAWEAAVIQIANNNIIPDLSFQSTR